MVLLGNQEAPGLYCVHLHLGLGLCSLWFRLLIGVPPTLQSPSQREDDAMEDRWEELSSSSLVEVVSWICDLYGLLPAPPEGKMCGFHATQDSDN